LEVSHVKAHVIEAASGEEGVTVAKKIRPEIVLMDFWLKGMNGVEAATQIKASVPDCSIILLTMFDLKDVEPMVSRDVVKEFISKSDLFEKLLPSIDKVLKTVINK